MEQNELRVMLAAYVLGEASDSERAEVERALESSPELRAERARLEATIGLVQTHMGNEAGAESLSPSAAAVLDRAAEGRARPTPSVDPSAGPSGRSSVSWYQRPSLRIAASVVFAGLVWATYREMQPSQPGEAGTADRPAFVYEILGDEPQERLAIAPEPLANLGYSDGDSYSELRDPHAGRGRGKPQAVELTSEDLEALEGLGYMGGASLGYVAEDDSVAEAPPGQASAVSPGEAASAPSSMKTSSLEQQRFQARGTSPGASSAAKEEGELLDALGLRELGYLDDSDEDLAAGSQGVQQSRRLKSLGYMDSDGTSQGVQPAAPTATPTLHPGSVVTGSDDFFLGRGELKKERVEPARDGAYRRRLESSDGSEPKGDLRGRVDDLYQSSEVESCLSGLRRRVDEAPRDMFFRFWGDNPFEYAALDQLSTFAADVDTASYTLARRYLLDGHLPTKAQVRTEEFVNYFDAEVAAPTEQTFAIHTELAPSRFGQREDAWMLRVAVAGKEVTRAERQPLTLTFVIDTSGSMAEEQRLELVKHSLRLLVSQLDARDSLSIVEFSDRARLVLPMTSARNRDLIESALFGLDSNGGTNAAAGLLLGYVQAEASLAAGTTNRVVLLSDGVANIGETDQGRLNGKVARFREAGIYLNTIGVGMDNHNDAFLEQLADKGDGLCNYIDDELEARRALVENFTGAFEPIARDVKLQVEFDPAQVEAYRLLGYENRAVADRDFRNDKVDAGEINAGHQVVALYEVIRTGRRSQSPLATVRLRWKRPYTEGVASRGDEVATEGFSQVRAGNAAASFAASSTGYRKSVLVAQFAEVLRMSTHARGDSFKDLIREARALERELETDADFTEFVGLLVRNRELLLERVQDYDRWARVQDQLRRGAYYSEQVRELEQRLEGLGREYPAGAREQAEFAARIAWIRERMDRLEASLNDDALQAMEREADVLHTRLTRLLDLLAQER